MKEKTGTSLGLKFFPSCSLSASLLIDLQLIGAQTEELRGNSLHDTCPQHCLALDEHTEKIVDRGWLNEFLVHMGQAGRKQFPDLVL